MLSILRMISQPYSAMIIILSVRMNQAFYQTRDKHNKGVQDRNDNYYGENNGKNKVNHSIRVFGFLPQRYK